MLQPRLFRRRRASYKRTHTCHPVSSDGPIWQRLLRNGELQRRSEGGGRDWYYIALRRHTFEQYSILWRRWSGDVRHAWRLHRTVGHGNRFSWKCLYCYNRRRKLYPHDYSCNWNNIYRCWNLWIRGPRLEWRRTRCHEHKTELPH